MENLKDYTTGTEEEMREESYIEDGSDAQEPGNGEMAGEKIINLKRKSIMKEIVSWLMVIAAAFVMAFVITHYVIIKAEIPTGSMQDTIQIDDRIIGLRLAYLFSEPKRGDIVIFKFPDNEEENYIKRVIGLPGETVEIIDGVVYINNIALEEDYTKEGTVGSFGPYIVPVDSYFTMGDNRQHSWDSRYWTNSFVHKDKILGKAWLRYVPSLQFIK